MIHAASLSDYNQVDALLAEAETIDMRAIREAETLEQEIHQAARKKRRSAAATRAERGELSLAQMEYLQAAQHFKNRRGDCHWRRGWELRTVSQSLRCSDAPVWRRER